MKKIDKLLFWLVFLIVLGGIFGSIVWSVVVGLVAALVVGWVVVALLMLQRLQIAKLQERVLSIMRQGESRPSVDVFEDLSPDRSEESFRTKKILDMLQAQQIGLELLAQQLEEHTKDSGSE